MKKIILVAIVSLSTVFTGCVTTNPDGTKITVADKAKQIYEDDGALIEGGVGLITTGIITFTQKNADRREQNRIQVLDLANKIRRASELAAKTSGGTVAPKDLVVLLKVEDDYTTRLIQSVVPLYSAGYMRLKGAQADPVKFATLTLNWINLIAQGIEDGSR